MARVRANVAVLQVLEQLRAEQRPATAEEQATLARWGGWGGVPGVFDPKAAAYSRFANERSQLRELLTEDEWAAAARSTINAHYTDAAYVEAIWTAVERLGFRGGTVLEPGCGAGTFLGLAPEGAHTIGVELDPVTSRVAAALYPDADVRNESFADSRIAEGAIDAVVGNVPFGDVVLHDARHNDAGHRIHNHFILKSLHLTRPGGLVAVITSRYTMDAANPAARREMGQLADLVGAVRLPSGAHRRAAGTDVVTDVLILRRREEGAAAAGEAFERSHSLALGDGAEPLRINEYFQAHPAHVLGELRVIQADLGRAELGVVGDRAAGPALAEALASIVERARERGLMMSPGSGAMAPAPVARVGGGLRATEGYLEARPDGTFTVVAGGAPVPHRVPASQAAELRALLGLRDAVVALLSAEAATVDTTDEITALRAALNTHYDSYLRRFGPLNRFTWRATGRVDSVTGEERMARIRPAMGGFGSDPYAKLVMALEEFEPSTQRATKAAIMRDRVVARRTPRLGADTPADALALCLDAFGEVRLPEVARLLGTDERTARAQLGTLVFDEPGSERLVPAPEYLSGNVRVKLAQAQAAAAGDARFAANVAALTGVLPRDLAPDEIDARLGAAWIAPRYVQAFLTEILEDDTVRVEHPGGSMWVVKSYLGSSVLARTKWGTDRVSALELAEALLEQRPIRVFDRDPDGRQIPNVTATLAANEKAAEIVERFREWVWEAPARAAELARTYNDLFNALVQRSYDGVTLSLPGLALSFQPRPHQVAAVARVIHEPAVGLYHEVGAGKTAEMVMGAMELKRLGLVSKPGVVVPNHMLEQFTREWLQLYPGARLLAASSEDLERDRRQLFVARCATGDWDAVVMTRGAFERIPMSLEAQRTYLQQEVAGLEAMLERARAEGGRYTLKRIEKAKLQAEERLKAKLDGAKDPGLTFEQVGLDYLFVDEAHAYKNLRNASRIPGMAVDGSKRASDLHMKVEWLRAQGRRHVATFATATPIANSMGEAYVMQRYLRPDVLEAAGITDFDTWAATFGETVSAIEVAPDGSGLRLQTRFAKFRNVPELLLQWKVSADIKTQEDLQLPLPAMAARPSDGSRLPETVVVPPSETLVGYMRRLAERADRVRGRGVDPSEDNLLKVSADGRAAALDLRLVASGTQEAQKVEVAATKIAAIYERHREAVYPGADGQPHPTRGALQLVFADLGTPDPGRWNVYEELRAQLVERGVPRAGIRFMHEARNDKEKGELFSACRNGEVAVLIGSTERMGVGTNVQRRAVALHHLDCPWRPVDLTQREGRIVRQGNANEEVRVLRYVTEGSFDGYLWQTVTRKAGFITQVMRGRLDVREIEDLGETALSYNEVKALATGNPLLLEQAQAQAEVQRLERLQRAHQRAQDTLRWTVRETEDRIRRLEARVGEAEVAIARRPPVTPEAFSLVLGDRSVSKTAEAGELLRRALSRELAIRRGGEGEVILGTYRGIGLTAKVSYSGCEVTVGLVGVPGSEMALEEDELPRVALVPRLDHKLTGLEALRENSRMEVGRARAEVVRAQAEMGKPFKHGAALDAGRARLRGLDEQLEKAAMPPPAAPPPPSVPEPQAPAVGSVAAAGMMSHTHEERTVAAGEVELER